MGRYRSLIYDAFRRKISPVASFCSRSNPRRSTISHPIFRNLVLQNAVKHNQRKSPNSFAKRRLYSNVNHSTANKELGRRNLIRLGFVGCGVSCVYYWNLETVPFTKRRYFALMPTCVEKKLGDKLSEYKLKENLVGWDQPERMRVEKIGQDMIRALLKGLRETNEHTTTCALLEEFNWEFIVVDEPTNVNAFCYPGGKIVVNARMFDYFKTDDEIAYIIGHEIGHAIARHHRTGICCVLIQYFMSDRFKRLSDLFIMLPLSRRDEMEADYIGMLVSAYAGYDPRIAPQVCFKFQSPVDDRWSTHPHGNKRARLLSQPKLMEEALSIYRQTSKDKDKETLDFLNRFIGISLIVFLFIL